MLRRYRCYVHYAGARSDPLFTTHDSLCALLLYCFCHFIVREAGNNTNATLRFPPPARDIEMCDNFPDLDVREPLLYTTALQVTGAIRLERSSKSSVSIARNRCD